MPNKGGQSQESSLHLHPDTPADNVRLTTESFHRDKMVVCDSFEAANGLLVKTYCFDGKYRK